MDNLEAVLQCLDDFERAKEKSIAPELDDLLSHIAKTGRTVFPWHLVKPLIAYKLERVLNDLFENNPSTNTYISEPTTKSKEFCPDATKMINKINCFTGAPFTIQRICELIVEPRKYYKTIDKFLRAIEKNIMVVSTVQPDGSLITRSSPIVLTNGDLSPTKTDTAPALPHLPSLNNSPLNTITQEHTPSPSAALTVATEEKAVSRSSEENSTDTKSDINLTQNSENEQLLTTEGEQCCKNGEIDSTTAGENTVDTTTKDSEDNCLENGASETEADETGKMEDLANNTTPTDEKHTSDDEKMGKS